MYAVLYTLLLDIVPSRAVTLAPHRRAEAAGTWTPGDVAGWSRGLHGHWKQPMWPISLPQAKGFVDAMATLGKLGPPSATTTVTTTVTTITPESIDDSTLNLECMPQEPAVAPIETQDLARQADPEDDNQCRSKEKLVFLHIPKNAGTSIEDAGYRAGHIWGRYMDFAGCDLGFNDCQAQWHAPPSKILHRSMYTDARVFCVVRHPYDRAVSEYKYLVKHPEWQSEFADIIQKEGCNATGLNDVLRLAMRKFQAGPSHEGMHFCHMVPQADYIWGPANGKGQRCRWCHEVIRFEELPKAFNDLMARFSYNVTMPEHQHNPGECPNLSVADISDDVLELLSEVYKDDLTMLNYEPIQPSNASAR